MLFEAVQQRSLFQETCTALTSTYYYSDYVLIVSLFFIEYVVTDRETKFLGWVMERRLRKVREFHIQ